MITDYMRKITPTDMELIHQIEDEFGTLLDCPDDHPTLLKLRERLDIGEDQGQYHEVSEHNKQIAEQLRSEHGISGRNLSLELGYSGGWFHKFIEGDSLCTLEHIEQFAEFFNVGYDYFKTNR